jgi:hypothetical protein
MNQHEQAEANKQMDRRRVAVEEKMKARAARFAALAENKVAGNQPSFKLPSSQPKKTLTPKAETETAGDDHSRFRVWND